MIIFIRLIIRFIALLFPFAQANAFDPRIGPFEHTHPQALMYPQGHESFDLYGALNGTYTDQTHCEGIANSFWIKEPPDGNSGDCIRYYPYGLKQDSNPVALIYFNGDVILRNIRDERFIAPSYQGITPYSLQYDMTEWSIQAQTPAILVARPGIYGSSGDHNMRRYPLEIDLMDDALNQLKQRYSITKFVLVGQSGGGHIIASLLNRRSDIKAVFIASGLLSVAKTLTYKANIPRVTGSLLPDPSGYYDPVTEVAKIDRTRPPDIFILSDVKDRSVPFATQLDYARALRETGLKPFHIVTTGEGKQHHLLYRQARLGAVMYMRNDTPADIVKALADPRTARVKTDAPL